MSAEIRVELISPPIPVREWDWCAWREGSLEDGPRGWGATSAEAIADLLWYEDSDVPRSSVAEQDSHKVKDAGSIPAGAKEDGARDKTCRPDTWTPFMEGSRASGDAGSPQILPKEPK